MVNVFQQDNENMFQVDGGPTLSVPQSLNSYATLHAVKGAVEAGIVAAVAEERAKGDASLASLQSQLTLAEADRDAFKAQLDVMPVVKVTK